jgi:hypothetical protein
MEIIGERSIRIEELEADIIDMKAIFHEQLEEAVGQVHALKQQLMGSSEATAAAVDVQGTGKVD